MKSPTVEDWEAVMLMLVVCVPLPVEVRLLPGLPVTVPVMEALPVEEA